MVVKPRKTTPTIREWRDAVSDAFRREVGRSPSERALSILYAQWALETASGRAMWCWNFAGLKAAGRPNRHWRGEACALDTSECDARGENCYRIKDRFRAYHSIRDGAGDWLAFLRRPGYERAFARIEAGDARGYARELRARGYYTASEREYVAGLEAAAARGVRELRALPPEGLGSVAVLAGLVGGAWAWWHLARREHPERTAA